MASLKEILADLVSFPSVTPLDAGCQAYLINFLENLGFVCQRFDKPPVSNFFARFGDKAPLLVFAGHTDVVPVGNEQGWHTPPFQLKEKEGLLYGRGVADMKGSLAAMMVMAEQFVKQHKANQGSLGFLITSGEEGDDYDKGTPYVMQELAKQQRLPQYCIVGEPSSTKELGDVIKIGRRGSLNGRLYLEGKQGHVAYPHLADNPIHHALAPLAELAAKVWDEGNTHFPATSLQITHLRSGGQATNIIPGDLLVDFNFRFSNEQSAEKLQAAVHACFANYSLKPKIDWRLSGLPFLTDKGQLLEKTVAAITTLTGRSPHLSTSGGTSDGRFIAPYGVEVIELGPNNATIHQLNESVPYLQLEQLSQVYYAIAKGLL